MVFILKTFQLRRSYIQRQIISYFRIINYKSNGKYKIIPPIYRVIRNDCRGFNNLPPRCPDATPCDFFIWGYVKDQVYAPPVPASIPELKVRIRIATETITADILQTVLNELDYRVDFCRITKGAYIEHL